MKNYEYFESGKLMTNDKEQCLEVAKSLAVVQFQLGGNVVPIYRKNIRVTLTDYVSSFGKYLLNVTAKIKISAETDMAFVNKCSRFGSFNALLRFIFKTTTSIQEQSAWPCCNVMEILLNSDQSTPNSYCSGEGGWQYLK